MFPVHEAHRSSSSEITRRALCLPDRANLRPLDRALYSLARASTSPGNGIYRDRDVLESLGHCWKCLKKYTESGSLGTLVSLPSCATDRSRAEVGEIAVKAFELSQTLREQWLTADYRAKRRLLEIICLNFTLEDVTLVPEWRKPFDELAKRPTAENSRADWI